MHENPGSFYVQHIINYTSPKEQAIHALYANAFKHGRATLNHPSTNHISY